MPKVKLFRKADQNLAPGGIRGGAAVVGLVNTSFSDTLGAGIGTFEDCAVEWTVTYDEVLFITEGDFTLRVGDRAYRAGPGDVLWIPRDTTVVYEAREKVTFFYATYPAANSPSTGQAISYPTAGPS
ncbi:MAG: cupin domain-containing protein [Alphaproteobacteria bacterium]